MGRLEKLRAAENAKTGTFVSEKFVVKVNDDTEKVRKRTRQFSIEAEVDDIERLKSAILKLSNRDNVLHKKKDIYIAMVKSFLDLVEKDIESVKII
jgi:hypothetical protein